MWFRHTGSPKFHAGDARDGSRVLDCNGRWSLTDETSGYVERSEHPPHDERCSVCQRVRIDQIRIEQGLAELELHTRFDLGGEA